MKLKSLPRVTVCMHADRPGDGLQGSPP